MRRYIKNFIITIVFASLLFFHDANSGSKLSVNIAGTIVNVSFLRQNNKIIECMISSRCSMRCVGFRQVVTKTEVQKLVKKQLIKLKRRDRDEEIDISLCKPISQYSALDKRFKKLVAEGTGLKGIK
ncbi:hypothetical protein ACQZV8_15765 [Magnetococcales bacterium HHB-1]